MVHEAVVTYINAQRSAGLADDATRAELLKNGWKEVDVADAFVALSVSPSPRGLADVIRSFSSETVFSFKGDPTEIGARFLLLGGTMFLVSSLALLYVGDVFSSGMEQIIFGFFTITHVLNILAAFFLFRALKGLSRSHAYRVFISLIALIVAVFAIVSTVHFAGIASGMNVNSIMPAVVLLITYFFILPLQVVVYLLSLISLWVVRVRRRRQGIIGVPPKLLFHSFWLFLVMAVLACGDFIFIFEGSNFF